VKADLFDRRFRSNLAVFDVKYKSIQYNTAGSLAATVPCSPQFTIGDQPVCAYGQATIASGDARAKGFEWENTFIPVNGLTLTANLGYTDFKFDDSTIFPGFVIQSGAPGYRPFARPKWTGQIAGQYESQAIFMGGHLFLRADANFKSKELLTSNLTTASTGITAPLNPAYTAAATAPFSWIVNGRVALTDMSLGRTKAEVAVWSRNLFNNRNITQFVGVQSLGFASAIYEPARTFGLDVSLTF
jgi:iron complex outermembrane receptor protein